MTYKDACWPRPAYRDTHLLARHNHTHTHIRTETSDTRSWYITTYTRRCQLQTTAPEPRRSKDIHHYDNIHDTRTHIERKRHKTTLGLVMREDDSITSYITRTVHVPPNTPARRRRRRRLNNNIMKENNHNRRWRRASSTVADVYLE